MSKDNPTLDRKENFYPRPYLKGLIKAASVDEDISKSKLIEKAVDHYFASMPSERLERLKMKAANY